MNKQQFDNANSYSPRLLNALTRQHTAYADFADMIYASSKGWHTPSFNQNDEGQLILARAYRKAAKKAPFMYEGKRGYIDQDILWIGYKNLVAYPSRKLADDTKTEEGRKFYAQITRTTGVEVKVFSNKKDRDYFCEIGFNAKAITASQAKKLAI